MKINYCLTLLFVSFLFIQQGFAQDGTYIEVISIDTIELKPTHFAYKISFGKEMDFLTGREPIEDQLGQEALFADLLKDLRKEKFNTKAAEEVDYSISGYGNPTNILIQLDNKEDLNRLFALLKTKEGISGSVEDVIFESPNAYFEESFKKLYSDALTQATMLAEISKHSLGALLSVSEIRGEYDGMSKMYEEMMKNMPLGLFGKSDVLKKSVERKFMFRFRLN